MAACVIKMIIMGNSIIAKMAYPNMLRGILTASSPSARPKSNITINKIKSQALRWVLVRQ